MSVNTIADEKGELIKEKLEELYTTSREIGTLLKEMQEVWGWDDYNSGYQDNVRLAEMDILLLIKAILDIKKKV